MDSQRRAATYSRPDVKEEAKVDVDNVAIAVNHNVAIMPVLDLENVARDRVGRH